MKYLAVIERASDNYSAFLPDVPGCVATGETIEEVKKKIAEALVIHLEGLAEDGQPAPEPRAQVVIKGNLRIIHESQCFLPVFMQAIQHISSGVNFFPTASLISSNSPIISWGHF